MATPLGDYLRARRAQVRPQDVGVPMDGVRRVPGLRREEVAMLARMSTDYYIRLEQGREKHPSAQVLDALSDALQLDDDARQHLSQVAGLTQGARRSMTPERVDPELLRLLDMWPHTPAIVLGRAYDVLAANRLAHAMFEGFRHGPNLMFKMFLDPGAKTFYPEWDVVAPQTVAGFRVLHGRNPDDPRIREVVAELTRRSPDFVEMWQRHDARRKRLDTKLFRHPEVGDLTLKLHGFDVRSAPGQELVVYQAEPHTASADALALLGTLAATRVREQQPG